MIGRGLPAVHLNSQLDRLGRRRSQLLQPLGSQRRSLKHPGFFGGDLRPIGCLQQRLQAEVRSLKMLIGLLEEVRPLLCISLARLTGSF